MAPPQTDVENNSRDEVDDMNDRRSLGELGGGPGNESGGASPPDIVKDVDDEDKEMTSFMKQVEDAGLASSIQHSESAKSIK